MEIASGPRTRIKPGKLPTLPLGRAGEKIALAFLKKNKFKIVVTGCRLGRGEIDVIAWDGDTLVFVEVKTRSGQAFGRPEEAVTAAKQRQVRSLARGYVAKNRLKDVNCRFDVVSVRIGADGRPLVEHFRDAF